MIQKDVPKNCLRFSKDQIQTHSWDWIDNNSVAEYRNRFWISNLETPQFSKHIDIVYYKYIFWQNFETLSSKKNEMDYMSRHAHMWDENRNSRNARDGHSMIFMTAKNC